MAALELLRKGLETASPHSTERSPMGLYAQLEATSEGATEEVWIILLDAGFKAWYAYFVAEPSIRHCIVGGLPSSELRALATSLCEVEAHKDVKDLFHYLFNVSHRCMAHRRKLRTPRASLRKYSMAYWCRRRIPRARTST